MSDNTVMDLHNKVMRCVACGDTIPIPSGSIKWVTTVMQAFVDAHSSASHIGQRTMLSIPRGEDGRVKPEVDCGNETELNAQITKWFMTGEVGSSSKAMAACIAGFDGGTNHPLDPDDFRRCVLFLNAVPEARKHLDKVRRLSREWNALICHWGEIEKVYKVG
jgi:hypothetical protein